MRWLKHMAATRKDEKIARLISKQGMAGYGLYWSVVEIIAAALDPKTHPEPSLSYPLSKWAAELQIHPPNVRRQLAAIAAEGLLTMSCSPAGDQLTASSNQAVITLTIPNLLKYRDEYSQRSGHSPDSVPSKRQNTETETEYTPKPPAPAKPAPAEKVQELSPLEAKVEEVARAIHERHPAVRRCGIVEVRKLLTAILKRSLAADRLALLDTINENHRELCASEQWTKDGCEFAKGLDNWLAPTKERYLTQPPAAREKAAEPPRMMM